MPETPAPIIAYFSHSYRPDDRRVNMEVWKRLNELGVIFSVDPPDREKRPMDITFLERMMQQSHCFIAIVPDRSRIASTSGDEEDRREPSWSPYQELEYRLAVRANKPRLLVVEHGIDRGPAPDNNALWFERDGLKFSEDFDDRIAAFVRDMHEKKSAYAANVGLLRWTPTHPSWTSMLDAVRAKLGSRCEMVEVSDDLPDHLLLAKARSMSVVVVDMNPHLTPAYVVGMLHGAAVPLFRTCLIDSDADIAGMSRELRLTTGNESGHAADAPLPPRLLHGYQVDERMHPVLFWTTGSIARDAATIAQVTDGYTQRDRRLEHKGSAREYFLSLRGNRVFVSTPGDLRELTETVARALDDAGMPAFHYTVSELDGGKPWQPQIFAKLKERDLLLGFISPTYWDREECVEELALAVERWEQHDMQIVLYAKGRPLPLPPLPAFLLRSQVNPIGTPEETATRAVTELQRRFSESLEQSLENAARPLLAPINRYVELKDAAVLRKLLVDTCRVPECDAKELIERVVASADPADELLSTLVSELGAGRYGGPALGRLCYWLRALEQSADVRDDLSKLFSVLRLFPGLHDVRAWNRRRKRRDIAITLKPDAPTDLLAYPARDPNSREAPVEPMRLLGEALPRYIVGADVAAISASRDTRVYVDCSVDALGVPVEWAVLPNMDAPLSRVRPLVRRIAGQTVRPRASLEQQFGDNLTGPPRVLVFGDISRLMHVDTELDAVERAFSTRYAASGWPAELIDRIPAKGGPPEEATRDALRSRLDGSDYDVLHLAGHAGFQGDDAVFLVAGDASKESVRGEELASWLRTSTVRFVYLSCCEGAASSLDPGQVNRWRRSLCKELIDAGVAEVVAYIWKVSDASSVGFTNAFYTAYVKDFDAAGATYEARRTSERSDALWAASVLVHVS